MCWHLGVSYALPSIAQWKAYGQLDIHHNWTFFAIFYGWDVISGNLPKSAFLEGGGSLWVQISDRRGRRPPTTVGVRKLEWLPFHVVSKHLECIVWFRHEVCVWQTDERTDGQNYDSQECTSKAASLGKRQHNWISTLLVILMSENEPPHEN